MLISSRQYLEITDVKSIVSDPQQEKNRIMETLKIDGLEIHVILAITIFIIIDTHFLEIHVEHSLLCVSLGSDVSVTLSMFDSQAVSFHNHMKGLRGDLRFL